MTTFDFCRPDLHHEPEYLSSTGTTHYHRSTIFFHLPESHLIVVRPLCASTSGHLLLKVQFRLARWDDRLIPLIQLALSPLHFNNGNQKLLNRGYSFLCLVWIRKVSPRGFFFHEVYSLNSLPLLWLVSELASVWIECLFIFSGSRDFSKNDSKQ